MTDSNQQQRPKAPTHIAYHVRDRKGKKGFWTRIGAAWPTKDGKGFNIQLDGFVPLDGRITLRVASRKEGLIQLNRAGLRLRPSTKGINYDFNETIYDLHARDARRRTRRRLQPDGRPCGH